MSGIAGPCGGTGGNINFDNDLAGRGVSRIRIWSGDYVNAIELTDGNGIAYVFGNTGTAALTVDITLQDGEYITQISGFYGDYIDSIEITTTQRIVGGGGSGGRVGYQYMPEAGQAITGFFGRSGDYIDALGVWFSSQH